MADKSLGKELAIGFGLGFLTNLIWALVSEQFNPYWITLIFIASIGLYYLVWVFILKPLRIVQKGKITGVYDSYEEAKPFLKQKLQESSKFRIITIGGGSIAEDERGWILETLEKRSHQDGAQIRILLLNPQSQATQGRFRELDAFHPRKFHPEALRHSIIANARKIVERSDKIEVRYFDAKPIWRLYILDEVAFVSFYLSDKEGHETQATVLRKGSDLFSAFERVFDSLWENGQIPSFSG